MWGERSRRRRRLEVSCRLSGRTRTRRRGPERCWPRGCGGGGSRERGGRPGEGPELAESRAGGSPASRESPVPPERRSLQGLVAGLQGGDSRHRSGFHSLPRGNLWPGSSSPPAICERINNYSTKEDLESTGRQINTPGLLESSLALCGTAAVFPWVPRRACQQGAIFKDTFI